MIATRTGNFGGRLGEAGIVRLPSRRAVSKMETAKLGVLEVVHKGRAGKLGVRNSECGVAAIGAPLERAMDDNPYEAPQESSPRTRRRERRKYGWELLIPVVVAIVILGFVIWGSLFNRVR